MNNAQFEQNLNQYVDILIKEKGLDKLPEEKQENMRERVKEVIVDAFNTEILRSLPDDKLQEFNQALDEDKSLDEIGEIVKSAGVDIDAILKKVLDVTRDTFLGLNIDLNAKKEEA